METYTTSEAAEMLGVTQARIRQLVSTGEMTAEKRGRDLFISRAEIEKAKRRKTNPGPAPGKRVGKSSKKASK